MSILERSSRKTMMVLLLSFVWLYFPSVIAQRSKLDSFVVNTPLSLRMSLQTGAVFPTNDFLRGQNFSKDTIDSYNSISFMLLKQTRGDKLWEQLYGYPIYGIGIYSAIFDETKELGIPISIYGFLSAPFIRFDKISFNYELGLGLAFNWKKFDPISNPNNIAVSAEQSVYIDAGVNLEYQLAEKYFVSLGYGFNHFSNGKLKLPNKGLNTKAVKLSLRYQLNNSPITYQKRVVPSFIQQTVWDFNIYGGAKNVIYKGEDVDISTKYEGVYYPVYGINNTLSRRFDDKSKIGFGFSLDYNGAINAQIAVEDGELEPIDQALGSHLELSVYPSYELVMDRLSLLIQPGIYVYRKKTNEMMPKFYQRIGIKYHVFKDYFVGVNLRAFNFYESDYIEWNIGRRITWH